MTSAVFTVAERFGVDPEQVRDRWTWQRLWLAWIWMQDSDDAVEERMEESRRDSGYGGRGGGQRESVVVRGFEAFAAACGARVTPYPKN